ncbi:hypothetical protein U91I_00156 [alpha proteobacterium U9-1i]|nr:hypothetical protein U91I_00156 [alpha proteobacterium U9-1i]
MHLLDLLFSFHGRINRAQYWLGSTLAGIGGMVLFQCASGLAARGAGTADMLGSAAAFSLLIVASVIVSTWWTLALQVKRFHDRGQSGWFATAPVLPLLGIASVLFGAIGDVSPTAALNAALTAAPEATPYFIALVAIYFGFFINLGCIDGVRGPNRYGAAPGAPPLPDTPAGRRAAKANAFTMHAAMNAVEQAVAEQLYPDPEPSRPAQAAFGRRVR